MYQDCSACKHPHEYHWGTKVNMTQLRNPQYAIPCEYKGCGCTTVDLGGSYGKTTALFDWMKE